MTTASAPRRPVRDQPTRISYAQLGLYGWFLYGFGASQSLLRDDQGTTRAVQALHGTALAVGAVLTGLLVPWLVHRWGRGRVLRTGSAVLAAGLLLYASGLPLPVTLAGAFVCSVGGGLALIAVNAFLSEHQGPAAPAALSEGNGVAALAGLLGPLTVGGGAALVLGWRAGLLVLVVLLLGLELWRGRDLGPYAATSGHRDDEPGHDPGGPLPRRYWWAWLLIVCTVGVEFCLTLWSADLLRDRGALGAAAASASLVCFVGGMAVGRFGGAWVVERVDPEWLLAAVLVLAGIGFGVLWAARTPALLLGALVVTGAGVGMQWPLGIARAVRAAAGRSDRASGRAGIAVGISSGSAPVLLAGLADTVGVHTAFLVVPALLAVGLVLVLARPIPP